MIKYMYKICDHFSISYSLKRFHNMYVINDLIVIYFLAHYNRINTDLRVLQKIETTMSWQLDDKIYV